MRAAIYARHSTEDRQATTIEAQISEAKQYAATQGWTVEDDHIYVDHTISQAPFTHRPALIALLCGCHDKQFDLVLARDATRLGRDTARTALLIEAIRDHGVRLHYYSGEDVVRDDAISKFMAAARQIASDLEREKAAERTRQYHRARRAATPVECTSSEAVSK